VSEGRAVIQSLVH